MNVDEIRKYCLAFPDATENLQWADDLCFKIRGRIFAIVTLTAVPQKLCFKCTPETFAELVEREDVHPAPYVGRYKWVMLHRLDALRHHELEDLIRQSYDMVALKAPKRAHSKLNPKRPPKSQNKKGKRRIVQRKTRGKGSSR
jgi:predicted DNA-binding protein (MmcQ/YjbR family)